MSVDLKNTKTIENLVKFGLNPTKEVHVNLPVAQLFEHAVLRSEVAVVEGGAIAVITSPHTGRSPNDKFIVNSGASAEKIWWGSVNKPMEPQAAARLKARVSAYLQGRDLYVVDAWGGTDPHARIPIRVITENAWHALFANNMFVRPTAQELASHSPEFMILHAPNFQCDSHIDSTRSNAAIVIDFERRYVLIAGTKYAGEMKKSVFTILNYLMPQKGILSMHASVNYSKSLGKNETAVFFGLSGTGKTSLSADPERILVGDDEHGWSDDGTFNFEGGCYAKLIRLSPEAEPEIYATTQRFGSVLENVVFDSDTRICDLNSETITENTRGCYPIDFIPSATLDGQGGHPKHIIMLTADAYGVLPPVSRLSSEQAMFHFLSGYTAKVAGTEKGITEPTATFSPCFGGPFLPLHPGVYAKMLGEKIAKHNVKVWLVNTGWTGGPYGVGSRIKISQTRAMVHAILSGQLNDTKTTPDPIFGIGVISQIPGVDSTLLQPRSTWKDASAYDAKAKDVAARFVKNFEQYADGVAPEVRAAAPKV